MATTAAEAAGHPAEKEKVEKRRALGRGLESLLPGRVVAGPAASTAVVPRQAIPGQGPGAAAKTEVPFGELRAGSHFVRDDNTEGDDRAQTFRHDPGEVARDASALGTASADLSAVVEMDVAARAA